MSFLWLVGGTLGCWACGTLTSMLQLAAQARAEGVDTIAGDICVDLIGVHGCASTRAL